MFTEDNGMIETGEKRTGEEGDYCDNVHQRGQAIRIISKLKDEDTAYSAPLDKPYSMGTPGA